MRYCLNSVSSLPFRNREIKQLKDEIVKCGEKKEYYQKHSLSLYEDLKSNIINEKDYKALKKMYSDEIEILDKRIDSINKEISVISNNNHSKYLEYAAVNKFENLSRKIIVTFINKIFVYDKKKIEIDFKFQTDYDIMRKYVNKALESSVSFDLIKEAD